MIRYQLATPKDNLQLIELTASAGMKGDISLRIDRKPDFFRLLQMRGESEVFVAKKDETIIGSICISSQDVYVGKKIVPLCYIGDFKVASGYRNQGIGLQLCNQLEDYLVPRGSDLAFLNVSKGNDKPLSFFRNRPGIPDFENIGIFKVLQFPGTRNKSKYLNQNIEAASVSDDLINFLNKHYSEYQLAPVITRRHLQGTENYVVKQNGQIIAAMSLIDTMEVKQNVVTGLSWKMSGVVKLMNAASRPLGISRMAGLHEPVKMIYIKYIAADNPGRSLVRALVNYARNIVYERSYSFVSLGLHEKDRLNDFLDGILKVTFKSVGMLVTLKNSQNLIEQVKNGIPFEDYSLV